MTGWRSELVQVRCSPEEKRAWQLAASRRGVSVSEFLRGALNGEGLTAGASTENTRVAKAERSELSSVADTVAPAASPCQADTPKGTRCKLCGKTH